MPFLRSLHGGSARVLREDFCGSAAVCREWLREGLRRGEAWRAVGVDVDRECVERARRVAGELGGLELECADAVKAEVGERGRSDVVFVGNFSIGYIWKRDELVRYLMRCRERLSGGGVMVCDTYDGAAAMQEGGTTRVHVGPGGVVVRATWEKRDADLLTRMVTNVLHFQVEMGGEVVERLASAFEYRWRLWGIAELREAMGEAGFSASEVFESMEEPVSALRHGREVSEAGAVCVVGRVLR